MTRIIFIHGMNNEGKSAEIIQQSWGDALNEGLRLAGRDPTQIEVQNCAYYGDELHKQTEDWDSRQHFKMYMGTEEFLVQELLELVEQQTVYREKFAADKRIDAFEMNDLFIINEYSKGCLLYTSPSPRD